MITAVMVDGSATTYCHVPVSGSKMSWMVGSWTGMEVARLWEERCAIAAAPKMVGFRRAAGREGEDFGVGLIGPFL